MNVDASPQQQVVRGRIRSLDGLRAFAVTAVILGHSTQVVDVPGWALLAGAPLFDGGLGVQVFFVLSGWLICSLLLREQSRGSIDLKAFYIRRSLRIWPAFYVFLLVIGLLALLGAIEVPGQDFVWAALFLGNYAPEPLAWWLGHTWSLAVEEQFYLLWPLLVRRFSARTNLWVCVVVIAVEPFVRIASYVLLPGWREQGDMFLHARMDALLFGCALALLPQAAPRLHARLVTLAGSAWGAPGALLALYACSVLTRQFGGTFLFTVGYTVEGAAMVVLICSLASTAPGRLDRALSWRPLVAVGSISFSLYLWQQLFCGSANTSITGVFPLSVACAVGAAVLTRVLVEKPFLTLKDRFARASL